MKLKVQLHKTLIFWKRININIFSFFEILKIEIKFLNLKLNGNVLVLIVKEIFFHYYILVLMYIYEW